MPNYYNLIRPSNFWKRLLELPRGRNKCLNKFNKFSVENCHFSPSRICIFFVLPTSKLGSEQRLTDKLILRHGRPNGSHHRILHNMTRKRIHEAMVYLGSTFVCSWSVVYFMKPLCKASLQLKRRMMPLHLNISSVALLTFKRKRWWQRKREIKRRPEKFEHFFLNNFILHFRDFQHTFMNNTNFNNFLTNNSINNCFTASFNPSSLKVEHRCYAWAGLPTLSWARN